MLIIVSPAKTLDFDTLPTTRVHTQPALLEESKQLIKHLQALSPVEISLLMKISDKLGHLNTLRFSEWRTPFTLDNAKQALLAFKGDVYAGIDAQSLSNQDLKFAQAHLRILSGLYGVLRPLDLMQAYRLEMSTSLFNDKGKNLYEFWGTKITDAINDAIKESNSEYLINLASNEYFKVLQADAITARTIVPVFKDYKNGQYKIISFYAKKARGLMSAYIIKNRLKNVESIKSFNSARYQFNASESSEMYWVFKRQPH